MIHPNANGSADLGLMQVNTIWVGPLARYARMSQPAVTQRLIDDPCFSIAASAAIMRLYLNQAHNDLMVAIGYYHSHTPYLGSIYRQKVVMSAAALFSHRQISNR